MNLGRVARHLFTPHWVIRRAFPESAMRAIESAIRESESTHAGELRFAVEAGLHLISLLRGQTPRQRAIEVFSQLRVWDTEHNSGVLIYLQLVDRKIEIVADRGIHRRVGEEQWNAVCRRMEARFRQREFEQGVLEGISEITAQLSRHFPTQGRKPDELPDKPVVL